MDLKTFNKMLNIQDRLNSKMISATWKDDMEDNDFKAALFAEAAELLESLNWKWWTKKENNIQNAKLEVVDLWFFMLSRILLYKESVKFDLTQEVVSHIKFRSKKELFMQRASSDKFVRKEIFSSLEFLNKRINIATPFLIEVSEYFFDSFKELFVLYVKKAILNEFRIDNGYKEGKYNKIWGGKEDNVWMEELSKDLDHLSVDFPELLYEKLESTYSLYKEKE